MASCLQKIPSGNESRAVGENDEIGIPSYRERSRLNKTCILRIKQNQYVCFAIYTELFTFKNTYSGRTSAKDCLMSSPIAIESKICWLNWMKWDKTYLFYIYSYHFIIIILVFAVAPKYSLKKSS